jgi:hypothetical protein
MHIEMLRIVDQVKAILNDKDVSLDSQKARLSLAYRRIADLNAQQAQNSNRQTELMRFQTTQTDPRSTTSKSAQLESWGLTAALYFQHLAPTEHQHAPEIQGAQQA